MGVMQSRTRPIASGGGLYSLTLLNELCESICNGNQSESGTEYA